MKKPYLRSGSNSANLNHTSFAIRLAYLSDSTSYIKEYPLPAEVYQKSSFYHNAVRTRLGKYLLIESFDENRLVTVNGKTYNVYKTYPNISGEGTEKNAAIFRYASARYQQSLRRYHARGVRS